MTIKVSEKPVLALQLHRLTSDAYPYPGMKYTYKITPVGTLKYSASRIAGHIKAIPDLNVTFDLARNSPKYDHLIVSFRSEVTREPQEYLTWFDENIRPIILSHSKEFETRVKELLTSNFSNNPNHTWF
jgi:hypothetical protein